jgi:hypothetical protein
VHKLNSLQAEKEFLTAQDSRFKAEVVGDTAIVGESSY